MTEENKPKKNIRFGAVQVAVWSNTRKVNGVDVEFLSAQVSRSYKDKNDEWQKTDSFGMNDIPKLVKALDEAYLSMIKKDSDEEQEEIVM